eukprot:jgi/Ulvmu1/9647/UM054_0079.1
MDARNGMPESGGENATGDIGKLINAMESLEEAVRCREAKVQDMQQRAHTARVRASSAQENQRACATELACAQQQLSVKQESLRILQTKRLQLTEDLTSLRNAEAATRKELNLCRDKFCDELNTKTQSLRKRCQDRNKESEGAAEQ